MKCETCVFAVFFPSRKASRRIRMMVASKPSACGNACNEGGVWTFAGASHPDRSAP